MTDRSSLLVLLALAAGCGGGVAVTGGAVATPSAHAAKLPAAYRAGGPWRYHYERTDTVISILPNGGRPQLVIERRLQLGWEVQEWANGLALIVTIDSARVIGAPGGGRAMEDSARGTIVRAMLSRDGRLTEITSSNDNGVAHSLRAELPWLVPILVSEGAAPVVDTVDGTVRFNVVDVVERGIRSTIADSAIVSTGTLVRDGMSPQLVLKGAGERRSVAKVRGDGHLDTLAGRDSVSMTITVTQVGQSVEIIQVGGYSLTPIP